PALARPEPGGDGPLDAVREIIADVRKRGDDALRDLTARFDGVQLEDLRVPPGDLSHALATLPPGFREALEFARDQIMAYHRTQVEEETRHEREGIVIRNLVRPVDVIVGPGNIYVTLAKREVAGVVGIEATAGPSELVVVADESAPPDYVAIDLMAQAEHGPNGAALLVTWSEALAADVAASIDRLLAESSRRADTEATLRSGGSIVLVDGPEQAMEVANIVAPEHLELMNADPA